MITLADVESSYKEYKDFEFPGNKLEHYNYCDRVFRKKIRDNVGKFLYHIDVLVYDNNVRSINYDQNNLRFLFKIMFFDDKLRPVEILLSDDYESLQEAEKDIQDIYIRNEFVPNPFKKS
jgi:hypothetical protein